MLSCMSVVAGGVRMYVVLAQFKSRSDIVIRRLFSKPFEETRTKAQKHKLTFVFNPHIGLQVVYEPRGAQ